MSPIRPLTRYDRVALILAGTVLGGILLGSSLLYWKVPAPSDLLEVALETEARYKHVFFPLMGIGLLGMAFLVGRGWFRKPASPKP